jgi:hypothetical protein
MTRNYKVLITVILAGSILFFLRKKTKKASPKTMKGPFLNNLVLFIKNKEGGLSNNANDPAAKFSAPVNEKYHTNKGVTYKTFIDSAASLKYNPSLDNFLKMPNNIWQSIFINKYYNRAKFTSNEILNGFIAYWYWQGWNPKFLPVKKVSDVLASKAPDKNKLEALVKLRKQYYQNIAQNNPKLSVFLKGWNNTANDYFTTFGPYL